MTHVYSPNQTSFSVCVVTYDLHFDGNDSDDVKPNDLIAAAIAPAKYNKDNSVEKNGQTPLGNGCFELSVPTLSTTATGSVNLGQPIQDVATLSGATTEPRATGDITFNLYGPDNATCSGAPIFTTSKSVDGNGAYTSNPFTPTVVGTYRWVASYSGDYNAESHKGNAATSGSCNDPGESSVVNAVVIEDPVIDVTKVADDAVVDAGSDIGFTMEVSNAGPGIARDVTLSDPLPGGDGISWSIVSGDDSCEVTGGLGSQVLACGPKDLSDGASFSVRVVSGTQSSGAVCSPATLDNTAVADAINADEVEASASVSVQCPGISITKVADAAVVDAGSDIGFTMVVTNDGPGLARGVTLNDPLPGGDGIDWSIASGDDSCEVTGGLGSQGLACGPKDLSAEASFSVRVVSGTQPSGEVCSPATLDNTAVADAINADEVEASASVSVQCPGISITKVADAAVVDAGSDIGFTMVVTNDGPGLARGVTLNDPLPNGVEWRIESSTLVDPEGAGCLITELNVLSCGPVDLAADASLTVHIVAGTSGIPEVCGRYDNEATVSLSNGPGDSADASTEVLCPLDITLEKDGPALAHRGDEITYDFAVTNSGAAELVTVDLSDPNCDESTLVQVSDGDGDSVLAPGETWRYECTRVITETDPNPLPNTATVVGTDERERSTEDTATHEVDLINPVIDIDKSVDDLRPFVGQTVTFTYVVTNTGDTTLYGIDVVDDVLGPVGTIDELGAGESAEFTLTELVAAATPAVNRGTAEGEDILGKSVTASDDAVITIVLDVVIVPVPDSPDLPRTGAELARLVEAALLLLLGGAILMRVVRGRRELTAQDD